MAADDITLMSSWEAFDLVMRVADGTLTGVEKIAEVLRGWISRR